MKAMRVFILILALGLASPLAAQNERFKKGGGSEKEEEEPQSTEKTKPAGKSDFWDRLVFGGGVGLSFGNVSTQVMLAPQVGYKFSDKFVAGPGFIFNYFKIKQVYNPGTGRFESADFENTVYGPSLTANYFASETIFLGSQFELLNHDYYYTDGINFYKDNRWSPVLWLQAGYRQPMGEKGFLQVGLRANVLHDNTSPYGSWWAPILTFFF